MRLDTLQRFIDHLDQAARDDTSVADGDATCFDADGHAHNIGKTSDEGSVPTTNSIPNNSAPSLSSIGHSAVHSSTNEPRNVVTGQDLHVVVRKMVIDELSKKSELQEQLDKTQGLLGDAIKQKDELTTEVANSKQAQAELLSHVSKLLERLDLKDTELKQAQASMLEATCASTEANASNKLLRGENDGLRQQLTESKASQLRTESELQKVQADLIEARSKVTYLRSIAEESGSRGKTKPNHIESLIRSNLKKVQIAVYFTDSPPRVILNQVGHHESPGISWMYHMDFWAYKMEQPRTIRIAVGQKKAVGEMAPLDDSTCRNMINHPSISQEQWNEGQSMDIHGWHHEMSFWAYPMERPGTIRIAVGEAKNPHCININKGEKTQEEWNQGASMTTGKWTHMMEFWAYPTE